MLQDSDILILRLSIIPDEYTNKAFGYKEYVCYQDYVDDGLHAGRYNSN